MLIKVVPLEVVWRIRREVMYPEETLMFVKLEDDEQGIHLGLYRDDQILSVISLFEKGHDLQFRKFATILPEQGKGHGSKLLYYVMEFAIAKKKKRIWCNARLSATGLYEKFGMVKTGEGWEKNGIEFIKMEKQLA